MDKLIFGREVMYRSYCPQCGEKNLSPKKSFLCDECGLSYKFDTITHSETICTNKRNRPASAAKKESLRRQQHNKCAYCDNEFGTHILYKSRSVVLTPQVDHFVPFTYTKVHAEDNMKLSCQLCNNVKNDKVYDTLSDARESLQQWWRYRESRGIIIKDPV